MKDTARKKDRSQGAPHIGQLALAAMFAARESLYETVVHAGIGVLAAMLEEDRTRLCGPRYEHDRGRRATRGGHTDGELPFGGRLVRVQRPRLLRLWKVETALGESEQGNEYLGQARHLCETARWKDCSDSALERSLEARVARHPQK